MDSTIIYDEGNKRDSDETAAVARFKDIENDGVTEITYVSRADWEGTIPKDVPHERAASEELKKACDDGCRILAYCTWSYTDLLSWSNGYQKRYGFVYVDRDEDENSGTLKRIPKDSYYWYKKVIETNGEEL